MPLTSALCSRLWLATLAGAGALFSLSPREAAAQGRLDAHYEATLSGIPVGKGSWTIEIGDDVFSATAQGGTAGLLKAFSGGNGSGASQGRIVSGALVASNYAATTNMSKKSETIRISLLNGNIREFAIEPEPPVDPDRVPVTDAQKKGVLDPMTGSMLRVPGTAELMSPDSAAPAPASSTAACATTSSSISSAWKR